MNETKFGPIKAIIGLGNPGKKFENTRHNIGFRIVDQLAQENGGTWEVKNNMEVCHIMIKGHKVLLVKPQTYMNNAGDVIPALQKMGIKADNLLVVHDELDLPFGTIKIKIGGSARGHNGLKSIISRIGDEFARLRFGIGRPKDKDDVPNYVLRDFTEILSEVEDAIEQALGIISNFILE